MLPTKKIRLEILFFIVFYQVCGYNEELLYRACRQEDGLFLCKDGSKCILRSDVRDVDYDCDDKSDEHLGLLNCTDSELRCRLSNQCVPHSRKIKEKGCKLYRIILRCMSEKEFTCAKTKLCIERWKVMDGNDDCSSNTVRDTSDEQTMLPSCNDLEYACDVTGNQPRRCIPRDWVMDGAQDCLAGDDERTPFSDCFNETEFLCPKQGRCIPRYRVMDKFEDCNDGADELGPLLCNSTLEFRCQVNGRCISRSWRGNKLNDCFDWSDEGDLYSNESCQTHEFLCHNRKRCIPTSYLCDSIDHCGDCSDEIENCEEPRMFRCSGNETGKCINREYSCDQYRDCSDFSDDITSITGFKCESKVTADYSRYCVIPQWTLESSYSSCNDNSDICYRNDTFQCARCLNNKTVIAPRQICDGVVDCPDLTDECLCFQYQHKQTNQVCERVCYGFDSNECSQCGPGELLCPEDEVCLSKKKICDGVIDCPLSGLDEKACTDQRTAGTTSIATDFRCPDIQTNEKALLEILNLPVPLTMLGPREAIRCNGIVECGKFEDECSDEANCTDKPRVCKEIPLNETNIPNFKFGSIPLEFTSRRCKHLLEVIFGWSVCNGILECLESGLDEKYCPDRIKCDAGDIHWPLGGRRKLVSVSKDKECDLVADCLDYTDEKNCSTDTHFYCENGKPLFVPRTKVVDGKPDCDDQSDECPESYFIQTGISSREELIKLLAFRILIWFMALCALVGNALVAIWTIRSLDFKSFGSSGKSSVGNVNKLLILNLSISDFLMGIALLIIVIETVIFSGKYCLNDKSWRSGQTCQLIGVLVALSSETSVLTLVCLASYRLYMIYWPYQSRFIRLRMLAIWLLLVWCTSLTVAVLPLAASLSRDMITSMWIENNKFFLTDILSFSDLKKFAQRITILKGANSSEHLPNDWYGLADYLTITFPDEAPKVKGYFGYYSSSGLCIPRFYRTTGDTSDINTLSSVVITFNFVAMVYIAACYTAVFKRTTKQRVDQSNSEAQQRRQRHTQRKITALILTDMCCWLPICIMTFLSMAGVSLEPAAYAASAVILLPINSSINPIIYTDVIPRLVKAFKAKCARVKYSQKKNRKRLKQVSQTSNQSAPNTKTAQASSVL
ncbi:uncharacterized protein LOC143463285 [Clavelina lepadiformis]|uniref:uncharacterized protein LOC143463285 n=1 Tax=Clavelina lepadiformis TaxID=159417 RepID=UPI0040415A5C